MSRRRPLLRVRKSGTALVASGIAFVGALPLAGVSPAWLPVLLIPLVALVWSWRAGTDVFDDEVRVRALIGGNRVPWSRITGLAPDERGRVSALLDNGNVIRLTGVTRDNLPLVLAAVGNAPADAAMEQ
ncbi:PH domain-containing protein [Actinoplanes sp. NPDC020271]|uniref:PH domain-containing protein n=1 Tax=Actinoplanes sp. NPDC020271 TaxID=3363896 RepID=UPI0037B92629